MIYDFGCRELHVVDLDNYCDAPFINEMGRMFGSSRFMAPEEFERGARIDERTTVFTMGRTATVLLSDGTLERRPFRGSDPLYEVVSPCLLQGSEKAIRLDGSLFCRVDGCTDRRVIVTLNYLTDSPLVAGHQRKSQPLRTHCQVIRGRTAGELFY